MNGLKRILVTGSAGFIGFHLVKKLIELNYEVIGIDNINDYYDVNLKYARLMQTGIIKDDIKYGQSIISNKYPNYTFSQLDLTDEEALRKCFAENKFDLVCNLAAQAGVRYSIENPNAYIQSNIVGFLNILEACRHEKVKHLIYASSSSVYGLNSKQPFATLDQTDSPISLYAATKKSNELMAHCYSHLYKLQTTGLRFFTVYGPWGRPDMAPILFASAICNNKSIKVFNHGNLERDFTYIDDIINGITSIIIKSLASNVRSDNQNLYNLYNIGNNKPVKLTRFIKALEDSLNLTAIKELLPMQSGDVYSTFADIEPLIRDFAYSPTIDIEEGVKRFIDWFKDFYNIERIL